MADKDFTIGIKGDASGFTAEVEKAVQDANKTAEKHSRLEKAAMNFRRQAVELTKQQRKLEFDSLGANQKIEALLRKKEQILARMKRHQGNDLRQSALRLSFAKNELKLLDLKRQKLGGIRGLLRTLAPELATRFGMGGFAGKMGGAFAGVGGVAGRGAGAGAGGKMAGAAGAAGGVVIGLVAGLAALVGAVGLASKKLISFAGEVANFSHQIGASTTVGQQFMAAGGRTGLSQGAIGQGVNRLAVLQAKANAGDKGAMDLLQGSGFTGDQIKGSTPADLFQQMGRNYSSENLSGGQLSNAHKIFGDLSKQIVPAFQKGFSEEVDGFFDNLIPEDLIEELQETWTILSASFGNIWDLIKSRLQPGIEFFVGLIAKAGKILADVLDAFVIVSAGFEAFKGAILSGSFLSAFDIAGDAAKAKRDELAKRRENLTKDTVTGTDIDVAVAEAEVKAAEKPLKFSRGKHADSLQRMGLFMDAGNPVMNEMREQTRYMKATSKASEKTAKALDEKL